LIVRLKPRGLDLQVVTAGGKKLKEKVPDESVVNTLVILRSGLTRDTFAPATLALWGL
jgi:hypothetical protein